MKSSLHCKNQTGHCWDLGGFKNLQVERNYGKRYGLRLHRLESLCYPLTAIWH